MTKLIDLVQAALGKGDTQAYRIAARIRRESIPSATESQVSGALQRLRRQGICCWDGRWQLATAPDSK